VRNRGHSDRLQLTLIVPRLAVGSRLALRLNLDFAELLNRLLGAGQSGTTTQRTNAVALLHETAFDRVYHAFGQSQRRHVSCQHLLVA